MFVNKIVNKKITKKSILLIINYFVIVMDDISESLAILAKDSQIELVSFKNALEYGIKNPKEGVLAGLDDVFTICYTSGMKYL